MQWLARFTDVFGIFQFLAGVAFVCAIGFMLSEFILPFNDLFYIIIFTISVISAILMVYFSMKMDKYFKNEPTSN
jgi:hypothetical protein